MMQPSSSSTVKDTEPLASFTIPGHQQAPFPKFSAYTLSPELKCRSLVMTLLYLYWFLQTLIPTCGCSKSKCERNLFPTISSAGDTPVVEWGEIR